VRAGRDMTQRHRLRAIADLRHDHGAAQRVRQQHAHHMVRVPDRIVIAWAAGKCQRVAAGHGKIERHLHRGVPAHEGGLDAFRRVRQRGGREIAAVTLIAGITGRECPARTAGGRRAAPIHVGRRCRQSRQQRITLKARIRYADGDLGPRAAHREQPFADGEGTRERHAALPAVCQGERPLPELPPHPVQRVDRQFGLGHAHVHALRVLAHQPPQRLPVPQLADRVGRADDLQRRAGRHRDRAFGREQIVQRVGRTGQSEIEAQRAVGDQCRAAVAHGRRNFEHAAAQLNQRSG